MPYPAAACDLEDAEELRQLRALDGMAAVESVLAQLPPGAEITAADALGLFTLVHDAVRDVLLWEPPAAANDN